MKERAVFYIYCGGVAIEVCFITSLLPFLCYLHGGQVALIAWVIAIQMLISKANMGEPSSDLLCSFYSQRCSAKGHQWQNRTWQKQKGPTLPEAFNLPTGTLPFYLDRFLCRCDASFTFPWLRHVLTIREDASLYCEFLQTDLFTFSYLFVASIWRHKNTSLCRR